MAEHFSSGSWTVLPGREDDFIAAWSDYARWTTEQVPGISSGVLLQSREAPNRFVSFGTWDSAEAVHEWRTSDAFEEHIAPVRELVEDFDVSEYDVRAEFGAQRQTA